jgi:glycosyltransferase involved in cell wall biosynthesis
MAQPDPQFSVLMPAHDAAATIDAAIVSVLRQTVRDFELIVIDDGSTDDTVERVRRLQTDRRVMLLEQPNAGPAAARNAGIAVSRAPIVSVIDSDDLWLPTYLEIMGSALQRDPRAGFAYTDAWVLDDARCLVARETAMSGQRPPSPVPTDPKDFLLELLDRNFVYTSASIPRNVLAEVGGYDERFRYGEDFELWLRIIESGRHAVRVSGDLGVHRTRTSSLTSDVRRFYQGICEVYGAIAREHKLDAEERAIALRRVDSWSQQLARLDDPSGRARLLAAAKQTRALMRSRRQWLKHPPAVVAQTLENCGITKQEKLTAFTDPITTL